MSYSGKGEMLKKNLAYFQTDSLPQVSWRSRRKEASIKPYTCVLLYCTVAYMNTGLGDVK